MIDAVLWDLDGTILNTTRLILGSYRFAFERILGLEIEDEEALRNFGRPLAEVMREFSEDRCEELIDAYREFNHAEHDAAIVPYAGILDALANIKRRGLLQALVTSKTEWLAKKGLEIFELDGYFTTIVGLESTDKHKPKPEPVLKALERLDIPAERAIFVGDSIVDSLCAYGAGVRFAHARWGPIHDGNSDLRADWKIDDPRDILYLLPKKSETIRPPR